MSTPTEPQPTLDTRLVGEMADLRRFVRRLAGSSAAAAVIPLAWPDRSKEPALGRIDHATLLEALESGGAALAHGAEPSRVLSLRSVVVEERAGERIPREFAGSRGIVRRGSSGRPTNERYARPAVALTETTFFTR